MNLNNLLIALLLASVFLTSCKKDPENPEPESSYSVPTTYNFSNVDYSESTTRLDMFSKIDSVTGKGTSGTIDAQVLKDMYSNSGNPFLQSSLNTSGYQLQNRTYPVEAQVMVLQFMDSIAEASLSYNVTYADGVAGLATSSPSNGSKQYLLAANGYEYKQIIQKFLMCNFIFHQIKDNYLSQAAIGNSVDTATMKHNWDLAFGLFSVAVDFPSNMTGARYLGKYTSEVNGPLNSSTVIMNAFLTGRAAINNNDLTTKTAQANIISDKLEQLLAAAAIHELNEAKASTAISDVALRSHLVSEGLGFILGLKYASTKIPSSQMDTILGYFPDNLYDIAPEDITNAINAISSYYDLGSVKSNL